MSSAEATLCAQLPREAQKTLYSILSRVALPSEADEKYRTLKLDNAALQQRLLKHDGALELLALCRFELRGRTLVLPADASADAIHRALDAITAAAAPAASVPPAAPAAVPPATAPTPTAATAAGRAQRPARAQRKYKRGQKNAAAPPRRTPPRERSSGAAGLRILPRGATAKLPPRLRQEPPRPRRHHRQATSGASVFASLRLRARRPRAVAVAVAHDATLDALREAIAAAGVEGAFALVRSLPHRVFDAELPGAQSLAALGLDDGLTLVAMPADARRPRVVRGSVLAALGNAQGDAADVDGMDYEELLELQERIGTATDERAAAAAALEYDDLRGLGGRCRGAKGGGRRRGALCGVHGGHRRRRCFTTRWPSADAEARRTAGGDAPCLWRRWLATCPKCPVCGHLC